MLKILKWTLFTLFCFLILDQALQWTQISDGWLQERRVVPYDPPLFNNEQRTSLLQMEGVADDEINSSLVGRFDAELGWAPVPGGADAWGRYDRVGARADGSPPAERTGSADGSTAGAPRRIVTVGCSYAFGLGVEENETWASQLESLRPDLEVVNLGVVGYGLDQALLRLWRDGMPLQPDEAWLVWRPGATLRMTTLYPPALAHSLPTVSFKPRYTMDGDSLRLVPNPAGSPAEVMRLLSDQSAFLDAVGKDDLWVRRSPEAWAPLGSHWSHRFALARLVITARELEHREPEHWVIDRTSEPNRLLRALVQQASERVTAAGGRFRLLVLPDRRDLQWRNASGTLGYWADPVVMLTGRGVEVVDLSSALETAGALTDAALWSSAHYGPELNKAVAGVLAEQVGAGQPAR
ncbi:MAG: SGNH/GDSL hydrolase family protein [Planctomycetota bacterium]